MLLKGSWAVRLHPEVWQWVRRASDRVSDGSKSAISLAQRRRAAGGRAAAKSIADGIAVKTAGDGATVKLPPDGAKAALTVTLDVHGAWSVDR